MGSGYWEQIAVLASINAIVALGFYVTFLTGQLSAAHAAFIGVGAYAAGLLSMKLGFPFLVAVLTASMASALVAAVLAGLLRRLTGMFLAIGTLAFAEIVIVLLKNSPALGGALGINGVPLRTTLWHVLAVLIVLVAVFWKLDGSRIGLRFRAVRDDAKAAAAMGIDVVRTRIVAFAFGGFLCGLGGALQVHYLGVMEPDDLGFAMTVSLLLFTVVGGRDYFAGPILGAILFTVLPELLRVSARGRLAIFSTLLVLIVILWPDGLIKRPVFWSFRWNRNQGRESSRDGSVDAPLKVK
jgi:branched-chain amino acid transport system permease protein